MAAQPVQQEGRVPLSIHILLVTAMLVNAGQFMTSSFIAVYLTTVLRYPAWQVGTVLTANLLCARLLPLVTGSIGDRTDHAVILIVGTLAIGAGCVGYAFVHIFPLFIGCACLLGFGTACYTPSIKSIFAAQSGAWRKRIFTRFNQALNMGAIVGPLLGGFLVMKNPSLLFLCSGILLCGIAFVFLLLRNRYQNTHTPTSFFKNLRVAFTFKPLLVFTATMILFWILFSQLTVSLPLQAVRISHQDASSGIVFIVNGIAGIIFMFALGSLLRTYSPFLCVGAGMICAGIGLGLVACFPTLAWLIICVGIYTLGETLVLPGSDITIAHLSPAGQSGSFFGIFALSWAIGGTIGNYLGTWLMSTQAASWSWILYGSIGIVAGLLMFKQARQA